MDEDKSEERIMKSIAFLHLSGGKFSTTTENSKHYRKN